MAQTILTVEILTAALEGFEAQKKRVESQIAEIKRSLHVDSPVAAVKRKVSAAARKRMATAQRKRWAAIKKKSAS